MSQVAWNILADIAYRAYCQRIVMRVGREYRVGSHGD